MGKDNTESAEPAPGRTTGMLASLQRLLGSFSAILHTRVEILSIEVEEAGWLIRQVMFYVLVSFLFFGLGLLILTLFIVKASPETSQLYVLGGFALLYLGIGTGTALLVRHKLKTRPRMFATTLDELSKDRDSLGSSS